MRLFDADEVDDVAERIAQSGRALGHDTFVLDRRQSRSHLDAAPGEVSRLKQLLAKTRDNHAAWRARVEDAVETVVASATEDDVLPALEGLVEVLRGGDDAR
jgi:DNA-binding ferritin-like protein